MGIYNFKDFQLLPSPSFLWGFKELRAIAYRTCATGFLEFKVIPSFPRLLNPRTDLLQQRYWIFEELRACANTMGATCFEV
ncbi:unnamed protein product [Caenorhabditis nigoni]